MEQSTLSNTSNTDTQQSNLKEELIRENLTTVLTKQPMLVAGLKALKYYDRAIEYVPKMLVFMMKHEEGISIIKGLGGYEFIRQFTDES